MQHHSFIFPERGIYYVQKSHVETKVGTQNWQMMTLTNYLGDIHVADGTVLPTSYWNFHLFMSSGEEVIGIGDMVYIKTGTVWKASKLSDYFGKNSPIQANIQKMETMKKDSDTQKFAHLKEKVMDELLKFMRPELVNRFDEAVVFEPLKYEHMAQIADLQFKGVRGMLEEQSYGLLVTDVAKRIVHIGFDHCIWRRDHCDEPFKNILKTYFENIIAGKVHEGDAILVDYDGTTTF